MTSSANMVRQTVCRCMLTSCIWHIYFYLFNIKQSGKKKAKKSVQFRDDDDVQVIYDYHDSPIVSPIPSPATQDNNGSTFDSGSYANSNNTGTDTNNTNRHQGGNSSDMAADLDKILDDVIQSSTSPGKQ
jgi:hypothetical protein